MGFISPSDPVSSITPRADTPAARQELDTDFDEASGVANPDMWMKYATVMKRPVSMDSVLTLWEEMGTWDLMAAALGELVEEATQRDPVNPGTLWFECNDPEVEEDLNDMLDALNIEEIITSQFWHVSCLGNHFEKVDYAANTGVTGLTFVHPKSIKRYWLEKNRQCVGFQWMERKPRKEDVFVAADGTTEIPRAAVVTQNRADDLWYPWDFLHFRRMFRMRQSEYGEAIFDEAQGIYKKLRMGVDQMVVHRAQVQPDRYVINIDTQDQPPTEQMRTVQRWKQTLRSRQSFGTGSVSELNSPTDFKSFYNPWALDSVLWVAMPKGFQHSIEKLAGTANVPDVYDIELLTDLFFSIIGMPKGWLGIGKSDSGNPPSGKSLLAQDIRFLRKVRSIRRPIISQYTWLGNFHAILKGRKDLDSIKIQAKMSDIGGLEDQMKMELLDVQADILQKLAIVMKDFNLPQEAWAELIFKRYLHLPDDVINVFLTALPTPMPAPEMESKSAAPSSRVLLERIDKVIGHEKATIKLKISAILESSRLDVATVKKYSVPSDVMSMPSAKAGDAIVSSDVKANGRSESMTVLHEWTGPTRVHESKSSGSIPSIQIVVAASDKVDESKTSEPESSNVPLFSDNKPKSGWRRYFSPRK